ncbi:cupin domain-containing protein [Paraburkholderia sp. IMGN_8]|uniref:cupin domain-containing protein n=1 Tax=Paraburkholderia sp. IMGN_8 TaxID=3136564 RepID=UPI00310132B3
MSEAIPSNAGAAHCTLLPAIPSEGVAAQLPVQRNVADGAALSASTQRMQCDEQVELEAGLLGEELAAVLEGRVDIVAADEHYVLSAGEAILIPPREARRYRCVTASCVLYRVTCNAEANKGPQE